jgi:hypothetical protein
VILKKDWLQKAVHLKKSIFTSKTQCAKQISRKTFIKLSIKLQELVRPLKNIKTPLTIFKKRWKTTWKKKEKVFQDFTFYRMMSY